jgi:hypothetical protein
MGEDSVAWEDKGSMGGLGSMGKIREAWEGIRVARKR